ncbi:MAG: hypothetical protein LBL21_03150 [Rickettsiales bacterium]|jgi:hypothetical protein|nr:hypothetical protein [Rickettsiales bacterium]
MTSEQDRRVAGARRGDEEEIRRDLAEMFRFFANLSAAARREGLAPICDSIEEEKTSQMRNGELIKKSLRLVVNGADDKVLAKAAEEARAVSDTFIKVILAATLAVQRGDKLAEIAAAMLKETPKKYKGAIEDALLGHGK